MSARALVIGAGPNGLAAAIRLAGAGIETTVLEAQPQPGGAVRTEELTLPGFRHDTFSSVYPAAAASPVFAGMPLADHGLAWIHPQVAMAHPLDDGRAVGLYRDLDATVASLEAQHAGDGRSWARFAAPYLRHFDAVRGTMLSGFPPVGGPLKLLAQAGPMATAQFGLLAATAAQTHARRLFSASGSRAWLLGAAAHGDAPVSARGSAVAGFYLNLLGHAVGWPSPRGGAQALTDALLGHLHALGGQVICDASVQCILTAGGRATGVALADGRRYDADAVLADVMPRALLDMTGNALNGWYRAGLVRFRQGPATVKVDWALDGPIPWSAPEARQAGTVHVGGDEASTIAALAAHDPGQPPFLLLGQQSIADPSRAPDGKHTAWAYTHGPRRRAGRALVRALRRGDRGTGRALRARLSRPHPRPARAGRRRDAGPRCQPRARRRRRRQLQRPAIGVSPAAHPVALPHAPGRPLPRQRRDVPGRGGARRAGRRRRPRGPARADRPARAIRRQGGRPQATSLASIVAPRRPGYPACVPGDELPRLSSGSRSITTHVLDSW